jgi:hypothetical protein
MTHETYPLTLRLCERALEMTGGREERMEETGAPLFALEKAWAQCKSGHVIGTG